MKPIFAKLPNGKSVFHGELDRGVFTRRIPHRYMRFSDLSFCLNASVIEDLFNRNCQTLEFVWIKSEEKVVYRIGFAYAREQCPIVRNEYNEPNLRIPIEECQIINRVSTAVSGKSKRIPEDLHDPEEKIKHDELDRQTSLF